jgi:hypothetical protein
VCSSDLITSTNDEGSLNRVVTSFQYKF